MVDRNKQCLAWEQDAPTILVTKIITMDDHYNAPPNMVGILIPNIKSG